MVVLGCNPAYAHLIDPFNAVPERSLILPLGVVQAYGGTTTDASKSDSFTYWEIPLGGGRALYRWLEGGLDTAVVVTPLELKDPLARLRVYGRVLLIPDALALQLGVWLPVAETSITRFEALMPLRYDAGPLLLFGETLFAYNLKNVWTLSSATALLYRLHPLFYFGLDVGVDVSKTTSLRVPVGLAVGIPLICDSFLKASFRFHNLIEKEGAAHNPRWANTGYGAASSDGVEDGASYGGYGVPQPMDASGESRWRGLDQRMINVTLVHPF